MEIFPAEAFDFFFLTSIENEASKEQEENFRVFLTYIYLHKRRILLVIFVNIESELALLRKWFSRQESSKLKLEKKNAWEGVSLFVKQTRF